MIKKFLHFICKNQVETQSLCVLETCTVKSQYSSELPSQIFDRYFIYGKYIYINYFLKEIELRSLLLLDELYVNKLQIFFTNDCIALRIFCILFVTTSKVERVVYLEIENA